MTGKVLSLKGPGGGGMANTERGSSGSSAVGTGYLPCVEHVICWLVSSSQPLLKVFTGSVPQRAG